MNKKIFSKKAWVMFALILIISAQPLSVFAANRHRNYPHKREVVVVRGAKYHYYGGKFYRPNIFGLGIAISIPPIGAIVTYLPSGHKRIITNNGVYYYYDDIYYTGCTGGYVVVPAPLINSRVMNVSNIYASQATVTVNIPDSRGGHVPVTLIKYKDGYIGPQGEYYSGNPTIKQLVVLYGR